MGTGPTVGVHCNTTRIDNDHRTVDHNNHHVDHDLDNNHNHEHINHNVDSGTHHDNNSAIDHHHLPGGDQYNPADERADHRQQ